MFTSSTRRLSTNQTKGSAAAQFRLQVEWFFVVVVGIVVFFGCVFAPWYGGGGATDIVRHAFCIRKRWKKRRRVRCSPRRAQECQGQMVRADGAVNTYQLNWMLLFLFYSVFDGRMGLFLIRWRCDARRSRWAKGVTILFGPFYRIPWTFTELIFGYDNDKKKQHPW